MQFIQKWDQRTSHFCLVHGYNHYQAKISRWISRTGDGPFYLIVGLALFICDGFRGELFLTQTLKAFAIELPLYLFLKNYFKRERPKNLPSFITPSDRYSLPSGHTAAAFLMAEMMSTFYPFMFWISFLWAGCISASRLLLGVHYLTDLLVGAALGFLAAHFILS